MATAPREKFDKSFLTSRNTIIRVTFNDNEVFRLQSCIPVDETVYRKRGLWSGEIVEVLKSKSKALHSGNGLDFNEEDIVEIYDETLQRVLFS